MMKKVITMLKTILLFLGVLILLGVPTAVIPNHWFGRMTPLYWWDYVFLTATSGLLAVAVMKKKSVTCTTGAGALNFFAIACPLCNKLLVALLSGAFLMTYLDPIRPLLGIMSIVVLIVALLKK